MELPKRIAVSLSLQELSAYIDAYLMDKADERVAWVLMVSVDNTTQYTSNCKREDGKELIESLLARWKANRAEIPAHYNPDISKRD